MGQELKKKKNNPQTKEGSKKISAYSNPSLLPRKHRNIRDAIKDLEIKCFSHSSLLGISSIPYKSNVPCGRTLRLLSPPSCQVLQTRIWLLFPSLSAQPSSPSSRAAPGPPQQRTQLQTYKQVEPLLRTSGML